MIVDAGMGDLIRPALYEGHHDIVPLKQSSGELRKVDVVGPICESGDFFCQDRELPDFQPGDFVALMSAGAYGFVMASNYNSRPLPAEILVKGSEATVARKRQSLANHSPVDPHCLQADLDTIPWHPGNALDEGLAVAKVRTQPQRREGDHPALGHVAVMAVDEEPAAGWQALVVLVVVADAESLG